MKGGILVILVLLLVRGRVPRAWLIGAALFAVLAFPVFQAYRMQVTGFRHMTNAQAAQNLGKVFSIALAGSEKVKGGFGGKAYRQQNFIERSSMKSAVELIVTRTGKDVPFQHGYTLQPFLAAFVPRLVWAEKPSDDAGLVFNREFHVSIFRDVYISPSHLGELYWNFGWPGALIGMSAIGLLLGFIGKRCDLSERRSVTRLLIVAITIYLICVRFEGSIAVNYVVWIRSLAAILLLHWLFARVKVRGERDSSRSRSAPSPLAIQPA
jgi:hypothetical protein